MGKECKNCGHPVTEKFCAHCGQKTSIVRFTFGHLFHEFIHGFYHFDHGLLFTAKELALRPGETIRNYLEGKRIRYFNPFTFILLLAGVNALLLKKLHWQNLFIDIGVLQTSDVNQEIWNSTIDHFAIRLLLSIPIYALITYGFYFKKHLNLAEHTIANTFIRAELNLFMIVVELVMFLLRGERSFVIYKAVMFFAFIIYTGWSYAGTFSKRVTTGSFFAGVFVALVASVLEISILNLIISRHLYP